MEEAPNPIEGLNATDAAAAIAELDVAALDAIPAEESRKGVVAAIAARRRELGEVAFELALDEDVDESEQLQAIAFAYGTGEVRLEAGGEFRTADRRLIAALDEHPLVRRAGEGT